MYCRIQLNVTISLNVTKIQNDVAGSAIITIDCYLIGGAGGNIEDHQAGIAAENIIIASDQCQARDGPTGVDAQKCVEIAAGGVDGDAGRKR